MESLAKYSDLEKLELALYLIDQSDDQESRSEYEQLANEFCWSYISRDNQGASGGRVYNAWLFHEHNHEYGIFLEEDLILRISAGRLAVHSDSSPDLSSSLN